MAHAPMSAHREARLRAASMRLTIARDPLRHRRSGADVLFQARDERGATVTVALSLSAWHTLEGEAGPAALDEVEELSLAGNWERYGAGRVWRVTLI